MRRLPIILACASAAALTTLAVTVAVPALADGAGAKDPDGFAACLRAHGLAGAPDDDALKPWLGERLKSGDATAKQAFQACVPQKPVIADPGPSEQELRSCLSEHGVEVPAGDGRALKNWLLEHSDDAANRDAMKACDIAPIPKPVDHGPCGGGKPVDPATERADKAAKAQAVGDGVHTAPAN